MIIGPLLKFHDERDILPGSFVAVSGQFVVSAVSYQYSWAINRAGRSRQVLKARCQHEVCSTPHQELQVTWIR